MSKDLKPEEIFESEMNAFLEKWNIKGDRINVKREMDQLARKLLAAHTRNYLKSIGRSISMLKDKLDATEKIMSKQKKK